jgi:hypothetical protein
MYHRYARRLLSRVMISIGFPNLADVGKISAGDVCSDNELTATAFLASNLSSTTTFTSLADCHRRPS